MRPVIIRDDDQLRGLLRGRRENLAIGQSELEQRIGLEEGYVAKLEAGPKRTFGKAMSWFVGNRLMWMLDGLGLAMVLVDKQTATELVAASVDPEPAVSEHQPYPGRRRAHRVSCERTFRYNVAMAG